MVECKICNVGFSESPDNIILCNHHDNVVHMGCCVAKCSMDGKPCQHCTSIFSKKNV